MRQASGPWCGAVHRKMIWRDCYLAEVEPPSENNPEGGHVVKVFRVPRHIWRTSIYYPLGL